MITYSDSEYQATKRIKQGRSRIDPPLAEIGAWISQRWDVTVLNVIYDEVDADTRLQVILEYEADLEVFLDATDGLNFDSRKQAAIKSQFQKIVGRINNENATGQGGGRRIRLFGAGSRRGGSYETKSMFVVFSAFERVALQEVDSKLSEVDIDLLKQQIGNPDLWAISRFFGDVTFMFNTDEQVAKYEAEGKKPEYAAMYIQMLSRYDEFGYVSLEGFRMKFDSKERFDEHYDGEWAFYYK